MTYLPIQSPSPSPSSASASSSSTYRDDSSEIDDLDHRSRRLTAILKKNVDKAEKRKSVLDVVRDKAWLLEDQVKLLERQTTAARKSLGRQSCRRKIIVLLAIFLTFIFIINKSIFTGLHGLIEGSLRKLSKNY